MPEPRGSMGGEQVAFVHELHFGSRALFRTRIERIENCFQAN